MVHKSVGGDDKKLQLTLRKLQANNITGIEEVRDVIDVCFAVPFL